MRGTARAGHTHRHTFDVGQIMSRIWTRDLLDNPAGRVLRRYVFPGLLLAIGIAEVITQKAKYKRYEYNGFDAVCIGVGFISIGLMSLVAVTPQISEKIDLRLKSRMMFVLSVVFICAFGTALLRNI